jgi:hypothetical protein
MASVTPRFLWQNFLHLTNTAVTVSSEDTSFPKRWLLDPLKTMRWRSKLGWTVVAGFNDKLDFDEGGSNRVATLTAGTYTTGAAYATMLQTAINAAAVSNTYTVTYSATTFKFTIARATGSTAVSLEWSTGANAGTSCGRDIGFIVSADDTGATTYTSDYACYQSRQYVKADLGSAMTVKALGLVGMQTLTTNGLVRLQGNATDAWTSPSYDQSFGPSAQADDVIAHWPSTSQTYRYWRIMLDDPYLSSGYQQVGLAYLGSYLEPTRAPQFGGVTEQHQPLAVIQQGDSGGIFTDNKSPARTFSLTFVILPDSDRLLIQAMQKSIGAKPIFFALDPQNAPTNILYGAVVEYGEFVHMAGGGATTGYWSWPCRILESLM